MILDRFRAWLKSLSEVEKSAVECPTGLSRRSFLKALGVTAVSVSTSGLLVAEPKVYTATYTFLRKEDWVRLDRSVLRATRYRLRAWSDLSDAFRDPPTVIQYSVTAELTKEVVVGTR